MHQVLIGHSDIEMSPHHIEDKKATWRKRNNKEVKFFNKDANFEKGVSWYRSLFNDNKKLQGEATPDYITTELAHERMGKIIPNAKMIILLRDPVKRAYSAFNHHSQLTLTPEAAKAWGWPDSSGSFEDFLKTEEESGRPNSGVLRAGLYASKLKSLYRFYPKDQILILVSEKMRKDPETTFKKVFNFLEINEEKLNYHRKISNRKYPKPLAKETEKKLADYYKQPNEELFELLGYRIKEWE